MHRDLCSCGSGRPFGRCHGDPGNDFAREQALAEARQIALLFPSVRLTDPRSLVLADRIAAQLGEDEEPPDEALDQVVTTARPDERRRVVDAWVSEYPDRWQSLSHTSGDVARAERELLDGAAAVAIHERMPTPRDRLVELELVELSPGPAFAFLVPPQFVWLYDEARAAAAADPEQMEEVGSALGRIAHVERVRGLADLLRRELPFAGFPRSSAAVAEAVAAVTDDLVFVRGVTTLCLIAYVHELALSYSTSAN